jgi:glycolate oxidase FAD binding subunit
MTTTTNVAEALTAITGPGHVRPNEDAIEVSPANTQQISEILRYANQNALTITPVGGGTKQSWGNPTKTTIHLDLTRLNRVIEHPWQDLTCTVQAGCTWQQLQQTLAKHGQFVALDPLWPDRATVGGILATNDSGALRHRYGSLRDLVIGMTLVLADGTIARSGGRVVKNVAGYDLCKLLTGSLGTLAVITEATFRLHPLPQHTQTFTVSAPQAAQLALLMASIRASQLLTQALQLRGDSNCFHLDIQLNAHPEAHQNDILAQTVQSFGLKVQNSTDEVWSARQLLFINGATVLKTSVSPDEICVYADHVEWASAHVEVESVHQALGIGFVQLNGQSSAVRELIQAMHRQSPHNGVKVTLLSTPNAGTDRWGAPSNAFPLMQAIKYQFDPNRTLNPGRFLGGI